MNLLTETLTANHNPAMDEHGLEGTLFNPDRVVDSPMHKAEDNNNAKSRHET